MPGITAVTRPVGSVNSKNGAVVEILRAGEPTDPAAVEEYMARLAAAPFREVALPLLGQERVSPCPVCQGEGTRLDLLEKIGVCYGRCGKVSLARLYHAIFLPPTGSKKAGRKKEDRLEGTATISPDTASCTGDRPEAATTDQECSR
jgi:hypothetical protein